jgi:2-methylisocitrate lyase-like PEP mutase family enzyme
LKARALRELVAAGRPIVTPTAHDALSARLIEQLGFPSIALGGSTMLASRYGLPDIGLAGFAEMVETARDIVGAATIPAIVDADDGYGDVRAVSRTVRAYEEIGVAALILEDQERAAKRPGDSDAAQVAHVDAMVPKIRAAIAARHDPDLMVVARTDSYALEGVEGVLSRCAAYLAAGADGIFVPAVSRLDDLERIGRAFPGVYKLIVQAEGSKTPWLPAGQLFGMGYTQIAYPSYLLNRIIAGIEDACAALGASGATAPPVFPRLGEVRRRFEEGVQADAWRRIERDFR